MDKFSHSYAFNVQGLFAHLKSKWLLSPLPNTSSISQYENRTGILDELIFDRERFRYSASVPLYQTMNVDRGEGRLDTWAIPKACIDMKVTHFYEEIGMERDVSKIDERLTLDVWHPLYSADGKILPPSKISFHAVLKEQDGVLRPLITRKDSYGLIRKNTVNLAETLPSTLFIPGSLPSFGMPSLRPY